MKRSFSILLSGAQLFFITPAFAQETSDQTVILEQDQAVLDRDKEIAQEINEKQDEMLRASTQDLDQKMKEFDALMKDRLEEMRERQEMLARAAAENEQRVEKQGDEKSSVSGGIWARLGTNEILPGLAAGLKGLLVLPKATGNDSLLPTIASLEVQMGKPVMRIFGETQLVPINIHQWGAASHYGAPGVHIVELTIVPLNAKGKVTLETFNKNEEIIGKTSFIATPEFAATYLGVIGLQNAVMLVTAKARMGVGGALAKDKDGMSGTLAVRGAIGASVAFGFQGGHGLDVNAEYAGSYSALNKENSGLKQTLGHIHEVGGGIHYSYILDDNNKAKFFVGPEANYERYDVKATNGGNGKDRGEAGFIGGVAGFQF